MTAKSFPSIMLRSVSPQPGGRSMARKRNQYCPHESAGCTILRMSPERSELSTTTMPSTASTTGVYSFYLAGQWLTSPQVADVVSPYDQRVIGRVSLAQAEHVERAIEAAVRAFALTRKLAAFERQSALSKISHELRGRA